MVRFSISSLLLLLSATPPAIGHDAVLSLHGSGTTNPSKCYWAIMEQFEARSKQPIRATYRAVGSTTGIAEFINTDDMSMPANDFASGDLPLNNTVYTNFNNSGIGIVHLPALLGAVSFFHSVPGISKLNLTACLLARIFSRDITSWDHADIVAINQELLQQFVEGEDMPITVARRVRGSSSTDAVTSYLRDACPDHWPEDKTGPLITWDEATSPCEGSSGMTACINSKEGVIGYIDAGHGTSAGLKEIELENRNGTLLSSQEASANGGIAAAENEALPASPDMDHSQVSLLNRPGKWTWPIVLMSYIYVRKDLSYLDDPNEQSLLVAFLKAVFDDDYVKQCVDNYGFTLPSPAAREYAMTGIGMLQVNENATEWVFESSTAPVAGAQDYVISVKRKRISDVERDSLADKVSALMEENTMLKSQMEASQSSGMTDEQEQQLKAALVLGSLSFVFCMILAAVTVARIVLMKA